MKKKEKEMYSFSWDDNDNDGDDGDDNDDNNGDNGDDDDDDDDECLFFSFVLFCPLDREQRQRGRRGGGEASLFFVEFCLRTWSRDAARTATARRTTRGATEDARPARASAAGRRVAAAERAMVRLSSAFSL